MRPCVFLLAAAAIAAPGPTTAQTTDGVAAIVDGEVISIAQVRRAATLLHEVTLRGAFLRCADLPHDGEIETLTSALECLIDTTLVFREVRRSPQLLTTESDVDARVEALRNEVRPADLTAELLRWQLTEIELRHVMRRQLLVAVYVDNRFRSTVQVSDDELLRAWESELVPDMRARGVAVPTFASVVDDFVRPLLQEREVNRLVQSWISDLRRRATIDRRFP